MIHHDLFHIELELTRHELMLLLSFVYSFLSIAAERTRNVNPRVDRVIQDRNNPIFYQYPPHNRSTSDSPPHQDQNNELIGHSFSISDFSLPQPPRESGMILFTFLANHILHHCSGQNTYFVFVDAPDT